MDLVGAGCAAFGACEMGVDVLGEGRGKGEKARRTGDLEVEAACVEYDVYGLWRCSNYGQEFVINIENESNVQIKISYL